jgi:hypothetical protein
MKKTGQEYCLNSRKWIVMMRHTPNSCPHAEQRLTACEDCAYYELRKPTKYFLNWLWIVRNCKR